MKADEAAELRNTALFREFTADTLAHQPHPGHKGLESIRRAEHRGHQIVVKTTYEITIDGKPLTTHVFVTMDGKLHSHALPNYIFASAIDLIKKIIDFFPNEFAPQNHGGHHGGHPHEHR
jgi:hypothetical protein